MPLIYQQVTLFKRAFEFNWKPLLSKMSPGKGCFIYKKLYSAINKAW